MSDAVVEVSNQSSRDIFISGDPNWDDQTLIINGHAANKLHRLAPGHSAQLAVPAESNGAFDEYALGLIVADGPDFDYGSAGAYQSTIGRQPETGRLGVTDETVLKAPAIRYAATNEGPGSMKLEFVDAKPQVPADKRSLSF